MTNGTRSAPRPAARTVGELGASGLQVGALLLAVLPLALLTWLAQRRVRAWWLLLPLSVGP